ncbi:MAG: glycosyltransferase family 2 protein [Gemmatimonadota bacterium]|nr:glycosyltransferase family 2 protein [Gemmatimonadota bacterium]
MISRIPYFSVIVPAYNGARVLPLSLAALCASDLPRDCWELIVVDDASSDDSSAVAARFADTVVRLPGRPKGPAYARNRGVEAARGECIVFVDADVCVHSDALRRFARVFATEPDVAAVFGAYDTRPAARSLVSEYRNLLHHYVHVQCEGDAETFWAGCGAIRRDAFMDAGMYNEWHYSTPQIEDIELGHRLRERGYRIVLRSKIQGTHLKRWLLRDLILTDLRSRGVPWMRLLIQRGAVKSTETLNLRAREKLSTALVGLALVLLALALMPPRRHWLALAAYALVPVLYLNLPLFVFFARQRGLLFALGTVPLRLLFYVVSGAAVPLGYFLHETIGEPRPEPEVEALAEVGQRSWPPSPARPIDERRRPASAS